MSNRTFNVLGWVFLIAGTVFAVGGVNGSGRGILPAVLLAAMSISLFWLGGRTAISKCR